MNSIIKNLGNIEFLHMFLELYNIKCNNVYSNFIIEKDILDLISLLLEKYSFDELYSSILHEARLRGLQYQDTIDNDNIFSNWKKYMKSHPTYIREIQSTNYMGNMHVFANTYLSFLDFPVRTACKILYEKGYTTYWSSANRDDYYKRKGDVMTDKSVAYILIDPKCLNDDLKKELLLDCGDNFWGIAEYYNENGHYYGIWEEIISSDMLCCKLSTNLKYKALNLPVLQEKKFIYK